MRGLRVGPSPWALRYRLHLLGVRAVSNPVDVTNEVLLLFSQPLHAFDLAQVRGNAIVVRRARDGETMATLDGIERRFVPDDLLICDGEGPVAVAGVMGGLSSEIRDDTADVLIECAHFDPRSIRRTSKRLGLSSESSYRFERGTDRGGVPRALAFAAGRMAELAGGRVCGDAIDGRRRARSVPVRLRPARVAHRGSRLRRGRDPRDADAWAAAAGARGRDGRSRARLATRPDAGDRPRRGGRAHRGVRFHRRAPRRP